MNGEQIIGRTIQLYLVNGKPNGLVIASIHGWSGSILVARNASLPDLLKRPEAKRVGIYLLQGPDPEDELKERVYVGEADAIDKRLPTSARDRGFWELAAIITTSDESLNKGYSRHLEAELIKIAEEAGRVILDNTQKPNAEKRYLSEAERANMLAFMENIKIILPVIGFNLLKPKPARDKSFKPQLQEFVVEHKSGVTATMIEVDDEYIVQKGSKALKDAGYKHNSYSAHRNALIDSGRLIEDGDHYRFTEDASFKSPSAAAAVVLDRNSNGRFEWKVKGSKASYDDWQSQQSELG